MTDPPAFAPKSPRSSPPLILASTSRFRRALLTARGIAHEARAPDFAEIEAPGEAPYAVAERFSREKARAIALPPGDFPVFVIGGDQTLEGPDGALLRKPSTRADSANRLKFLAGTTHTLHSGLALRAITPQGDAISSVVVSIAITLRALTDREIAKYLDEEDVTGSVSAYLYEGLGATLIEEVRFLPTRFPSGQIAAVGDDSAIVGLPLLALFRLLRDAGYYALSDR